jgi:hypothetical protein
MEEPAFVSHGESLSPRAREILVTAARQCEPDQCVVILEGGRSSELIARSLGIEPPKAGQYASVTVGSASQAIGYLREDGLTQMAEDMEVTVTRCPPSALVMLHAWGNCYGVLLYARPEPLPPATEVVAAPAN